MINAVELAQISGNSMPSFQTNDKGAEVFIEEAEKALENVESETNWGKTISRSIFKTASKRNSNLSIIALWHFENGLEKLSQAIKNLEQAKFFNSPRTRGGCLSLCAWRFFCRSPWLPVWPSHKRQLSPSRQIASISATLSPSKLR